MSDGFARARSRRAARHSARRWETFCLRHLPCCPQAQGSPHTTQAVAHSRSSSCLQCKLHWPSSESTDSYRASLSFIFRFAWRRSSARSSWLFTTSFTRVRRSTSAMNAEKVSTSKLHSNQSAHFAFNVNQASTAKTTWESILVRTSPVASNRKWLHNRQITDTLIPSRVSVCIRVPEDTRIKTSGRFSTWHSGFFLGLKVWHVVFGDGFVVLYDLCSLHLTIAVGYDCNVMILFYVIFYVVQFELNFPLRRHRAGTLRTRLMRRQILSG